MRLDDSGIGAPSVEVLDSAVSAMDHPFLRAMHAPSTSSPQPLAGGNEVGPSTQLSSLRKPEEDDMAYFERQYQERIKLEKAAKQKGKVPPLPSTKPS